MANRLNNLVPSHNQSSYNGMNMSSVPMNFANPSPFGTSTGGSYPPAMPHMSIPGPGQQQMQMPEIRNEADLSMFNQFMMSLGRDAANNVPHAMAHGASYDSNSGSSASPHSTESPIEDLFNPDELASLGLSGMPGISSSLPTDLGMNQSYGHMYPSLSGLDMPARQRAVSSTEFDMSKRPIANLPRHHSAATKGINGYPSTFTMDNSYTDIPDFAHSGSDFSNTLSGDFSSFDSLARSKNPMPAATMAPRDFYKKTYRHVAPLGAAVSSRQSALRESSERTEMDDDDEDNRSASASSDMTPKISVKSLLVDDEDIDPELRLPAISTRQHASFSIPSLHDSHLDVYTSRPTTSDSHLPAKRHTEDELTGGVKRLELADREYSSSRSPEVVDSPRRVSSPDRVRELRRRHTALIKSWIVAVNIGFMRRQAEEAARRMDQVDEDEEEEIESPMTPRARELVA
jgi:hypothetical protein